MPGGNRAVILLDGVVGQALKKLTPDISWTFYAKLLGIRRPDLAILHLHQEHDWGAILSGRAGDYSDLVRGMAEEVVQLAGMRWDSLTVLGFSLGGLTALDLANTVGRMAPEMLPARLTYVTFGTPFGGTGYLQDEMLRRLKVSYLDRIYDRETTRRYFKELLGFARERPLHIMLGAIEHDEMVAPHSALLPAEWLYFSQHLPHLSWDTFTITPRRRLRAHDGLLADEDALAYINGLVDELLPQQTAGQG
jgi:hypothetical protein